MPYLILIAAAGAASLAASAWLFRTIIVHMPADYFTSEHPAPSDWRRRRPVVRWTLRILKNLAGVVLLASGLTMLVTPGPGVAAILVGLSLVDLPGKRELQRRIVGLPRVLERINRIRARSGQAPLNVEPYPKVPSQRVSTWPNR